MLSAHEALEWVLTSLASLVQVLQGLTISYLVVSFPPRLSLSTSLGDRVRKRPALLTHLPLVNAASLGIGDCSQPFD